MTSETLLWGLAIASLMGLALLTLLVIGLLRSYGEIVKVLHDAGIRVEPDDGRRQQSPVPAHHGPSTGEPARAVSGETLSGGLKAITVTGADDHLLFAFMSSGCGSCITYWRELRANGGKLPELDASVVVVTKGPDREEPGKLAELSGGEFDVLMSDDSWSEYDVPVTPHFVLVDRSNGTIIGEGSSPDPDALSELMRRAALDAQSITRRELLTRRPGREA